MLHTINFNLKISSQNYNINFSTLKKYVNALDYNLYPDKNNSKRYQCYKTHCFNDIGISTINLCRYFGKKSGAYIELVVNCPKVIYNGDETRLANVTDYNILEEKFNHIIQHLNNEIFGTKLLPNLNDWLVRRIDYAFDIETPNVDHYISIFNKGYIPKSFSLKTYYNTSFHIKSDACNYNFYNKTKELSSKHNIHINSNVLRLEVQCKTDKIRKLIKHYDLHSNNISLLWNESIAKEVITEAVTRVIGTYDFYPLNVLHDKIYNSILPKAYKHYAWQLTKLLNNDIYVNVEGINELVLLNLMGDGLKKYLSVILPIFVNKYSIISIDEIENGLHNKAIRHLLRSILTLSRNNDMQMFFTTHNYNVLRIISDIVTNEDYFKDLKDIINIINIYNTENEGFKTYNYDVDSAREFIENNSNQ